MVEVLKQEWLLKGVATSGSSFGTCSEDLNMGCYMDLLLFLRALWAQPQETVGVEGGQGVNVYILPVYAVI